MVFRISSPTISSDGEHSYYRATVTNGDLFAQVEISVPQAFGDFLAPTCDPVVVAALLPAMRTGHDIEIEGPVSPHLLSALQRALPVVLRGNMPYLKAVKVRHHGALYAPEQRGTAIATGFSGGIDSFCTLQDYYFEAHGDHERLTHLISNSFTRFRGLGENERSVVRRLSAEIGLPLIEVNSNLDILSSPPWVARDIQPSQTHTLWNAAVALALQGQVSRFYYSSGIAYPSLHYQADTDITYTDPEILRLLTTDGIILSSVGCELSRVEKTRQVSLVEHSRNYLNVCVSPDRVGAQIRNCGTCKKCKRTLLTLDLTSGTESYGTIFDLSAWRSVRPAYLRDVMVNTDPLSQELQALLAQSGEVLPLADRVRVRRIRSIQRLRRSLGRIARALLPRRLYDSLRRSGGKAI